MTPAQTQRAEELLKLGLIVSAAAQQDNSTVSVTQGNHIPSPPKPPSAATAEATAANQAGGTSPLLNQGSTASNISSLVVSGVNAPPPPPPLSSSPASELARGSPNQSPTKIGDDLGNALPIHHEPCFDSIPLDPSRVFALALPRCVYQAEVD